MASGDGAAESDPASSSDVEITGAEPANVAYDSDDEKYTCVVCKGKRNAGMLVCAECGLQAHSECYFKPKSTAEQDSISEGDAWKCMLVNLTVPVAKICTPLELVSDSPACSNSWPR